MNEANFVRCPNNHYYDQAKYHSCPHCVKDDVQPTGRIATDGEVISPVPMPNPVNVKAAGYAESPSPEVPSQPAQNRYEEANIAPSRATGASTRTVTGKLPIAGWLVCIKGVHRGEEFRLRVGKNYIGRALGMDVSLSADHSISRERHAAIEYKAEENCFYIESGESSGLVYLNNDLVLVPTRMKSRDKIRLGDALLMFIPCCSKNFCWNTDDE